MMERLRRVSAFLALPLTLAALAVGCATTAARAGAGSTAIVDQLPAQIPEILTGGKWSNGEIGGTYRAVVVMADADRSTPRPAVAAPAATPATAAPNGDAAPKAEVYIQWIATAGGEPAKIVKTVSIKEFNDQQLRHAFLAMDTLKDNEVTLLVTSYDEQKDQDISVSVKATAPGVYQPSR